MIGLSLTAIGMRPLIDCITITDELADSLHIDFLELAIGVPCDVHDDYGNWPLVFHDNCLWDESGRLRLDPLNPKSWAPYLSFASRHNIIAIGVHAPAKRRCTSAELTNAVASMEDEFGIPVSVEVMPSRNRWCSDIDSLVDTKLVLDVSHVLIWERGDLAAAERTCRRLLDTFEVGEIHLSHNDGRHDSHELIPEGIWFESLVPTWSRSHLVTYESLPERCRQFERLDIARNRWTQSMA